MLAKVKGEFVHHPWLMVLSLGEVDKNCSNGGGNQDKLSKDVVIYSFQNSDTHKKAKEDYRYGDQVYFKCVPGNGAPTENMEGHFEKVDDQKQPCRGTNKLIFWKPHSKKEDIGKGPCQITYHGGESGNQTHGTGNSDMFWNMLRLSLIPPPHYSDCNKDDDRHALAKYVLIHSMTNPCAEHHANHHKRH